MPTEKDVLEWLALNWPSLALVSVLVKVYLKIRAIPVRLSRAEKRIDRILEVCTKQHPDQGAFLFRDTDKGEE